MHNKSQSVNVMVRRRPGEKPLLGPILTKSTDAYILQHALLGLQETTTSLAMPYLLQFHDGIPLSDFRFYMMTSSNGNIFRFTGHQWIPLTKASDAELWCFLWSAPE